MAARCTEAGLRAEVEEMAARAGIGPISVAFPAALEAEHRRDERRYAQVDLPRLRFEFARSILDLEPRYREALIAHEVGHVIADQRGLTSSEEEADQMAAEVLGVEIAYDTSWPGKGLQMKATPIQRNAPSTVPFPDGRTPGDYRDDGMWDCRHAFSINEFRDEMNRFPLGHNGGDPNAVFDRVWTPGFRDGYFEDWIPSQDDLRDHPRVREAYDAWVSGWKSCAVGKLKERMIERWHEILADADLFYVLDPDGVELDRFDDLEEALRVLARMPVNSTLEMAIEGDRHSRAVLAAIDPEYDELHMQLHPLYALPVHGYPVGDRLGAFPALRRAAKKAGIAYPPRANPSRSSTEAIDAFDKAMIDPDPSSTAVAQDIAEENGLKLRDLGARHRPDYQGKINPRWGRFWFDGGGRAGYAVWSIVLDEHRPFDGLSPEPRLLLTWLIGRATERIPDDQWGDAVDRGAAGRESIRLARKPTYADEKAYERELMDTGAARAWMILAVMKEHYDSADLAERIDELKKTYRPLSAALKGNPMPKKNVDDIESARNKYEEFHRYAPKKEIFEGSFKIPARLLCAGKSKWVTYRSGKVDPATLKKPKHPVDYIHEHNAGVHTYIPDKNPDTQVPEEFREVSALTRLGICLGFCVETDEGEVEAEANDAGGMPELYATPDGKCLLVIQSRKKVIAMMWGGGLGVFARGIDG